MIDTSTRPKVTLTRPITVKKVAPKIETPIDLDDLLTPEDSPRQENSDEEIAFLIKRANPVRLPTERIKRIIIDTPLKTFVQSNEFISFTPIE
jgi:hypothetical protein